MRSQGKKLARAAQLVARGELRIPRGSDAAAEPENEVEKALAAFGLQADAPLDVEQEFALWPDCVEIFNFWAAVQTQWRIGDMRGATGLDYAGVESCMRMRRVPSRERDELLHWVQVMERAALKEWSSTK